MDAESLADTVERAAKAGAEPAETLFRTALDVEEKSSPVDLVTEADRTAQRRAIEVIREADPDAVVVAEEEDERKHVPETGRAWVIDPIDGTTNYVHGLRVWATSVAVVEGGEARAAANLAPALGDRYLARGGVTTRNDAVVGVSTATNPDEFVVAPVLRWRRDDHEEFGALANLAVERFGEVRRLGSSQVTLSMVASGELDAAISTAGRANPWDTIAGVHLVRCAGGVVTDLAGERWTPASDGLIASNGEAHEPLLAAIRGALDRYDS